MFRANQAYFQTQVTTTSQGEILVLLYDGAIKFLNAAKVKIEEKDYAEKGVLISKALDIIAELDANLNKEKGGTISTNLHSLYLYCQNKLLQANLKMNVEMIDEVLNILTPLRGAFAEVIFTPEALKAQKEAPVQAPVNVNSFRQREAPLPSAQATGTSVSTMARAYKQQSTNFGTKSAVSETVSTPREAPVAEAPMATAAPTTPVAPASPAHVVTPIAAAGPISTAANGLAGFASQLASTSLYKQQMSMAK